MTGLSLRRIPRFREPDGLREANAHCASEPPVSATVPDGAVCRLMDRLWQSLRPRLLALNEDGMPVVVQPGAESSPGVQGRYGDLRWLVFAGLHRRIRVHRLELNLDAADRTVRVREYWVRWPAPRVGEGPRCAGGGPPGFRSSRGATSVRWGFTPGPGGGAHRLAGRDVDV